MIPSPPNTTGYIGSTAIIPLGRAGLFTDAAQTDIPTSGLIRANNATYYNQIVQKDYGSRIWNSTPLPSPILRAKEMYVDPQSQKQRLFALTAAGKLYKFSSPTVQAEVTASGGAPATLNALGHTCMVVGGNELLNFNKKLFTFDGNDSPQVVSGDAVIRTNISKPAADWTGTYQPFGAVMHRGSLYCWGNGNNPHQVYASSVTDHEDFQTNGSFFTYSVYPGEFDGIVCGGVFRGRLYVLKYPLGLYYLVDSDSNRTNWYFTKQSDDFGAASPQSATVALNDLMVANNYGSVTSLSAALVFGDTIASDIFHSKSCFKFLEEEIRSDITKVRSMVFYMKKRQLLISYQSNVGSSPDRIAVIDFKNPQSQPRISFSTKDQANCLFLVRQAQGLHKPFYGSNDGNLYEMDMPDLWVGSATDTTNQRAYTFDIQTPHMDFSQDSTQLGSQVKTFEFLEVQYEPTGDFNCNVDVIIDGRAQGTYQFNLGARSNLGQMPLNSSVVDGLAGFYRRFQIYGDGRCISLRFYNAEMGQGVRLVRAVIYYRVAGQQQMMG